MQERSFGLRFGAVVLILAMAPGLAMAYIDPGNGAYMVQALFTLVAAGLFYLRHPVQSLKAFGRWCSTLFTSRSDREASQGIEGSVGTSPTTDES